MLKLRGGTATEANANAIFRQLFLDKLPLTIRTALAIHSGKSLENLAKMADTMAEIQGPQAQGLGQATICAVKPAKPTGMAETRKELDNIWRELKAQRRPEAKG